MTLTQVSEGFLVRGRALLVHRGATVWVCGFIVAAVGLLTAISPWLPLADPAKQNLRHTIQEPSIFGGEGGYVLGSDALGQDILARLVEGARISLAVTLSAVLIAMVVGVTLGVLAGYLRGWADAIISRLIDAQLSIPYVLLALGIISVSGRSLLTLTIVLAIVGWAPIARVVRSRTIAIRGSAFVESLKVTGVRNSRIIIFHILPNLRTVILTVGTLQIGELVLFESALSFLGLGVTAPDISWGQMLADGRQYMQENAWLVVLPGLCIAGLVVCISVLGDEMGRERNV